MIKILWFTNTVSGAEKLLEQKSVGGGWIKSLEGMVRGQIDLNIAFYYRKPISPFSIEGTQYFPILKEKNIKSRPMARHDRKSQ